MSKEYKEHEARARELLKRTGYEHREKRAEGGRSDHKDGHKSKHGDKKGTRVIIAVNAAPKPQPTPVPVPVRAPPPPGIGGPPPGMTPPPGVPMRPPGAAMAGMPPQGPMMRGGRTRGGR